LYCVLEQGLADPLGWQDIHQGIPQLLITVLLLPPLHILQIALELSDSGLDLVHAL
jgi:hypothetical protein